MNELAPIIFNEVKEAQKELSALGAHVVNMSFPTEYPWEVFISSRSWVVPDDGEYFIVCIGGGGGSGWSGGRSGDLPFKGCGMGGTSGGAGGYTNGTGGGGSGALAFARRELSKGATIVVTIGAAGNSGYTNNEHGSAGGNSSVVGGGVNISCNGGAGSLGGTSTRGAQSMAQAAGGDININGESGGAGSTAGGGGGGGGFGVGGQWATGSAGAPGGSGGGGGGGGRDAAPPGPSGQILSILSVIPGYMGAGSLHGGFAAIRRVR